MALFNPPPAAPQRGDRTTFSQRMDAFLVWLVGLIPQLNTFFGGLSSLAAGGAASFSYTFDASTANTDLAPGALRLGSTTQNVASTLRLDALDNGQVDVTAFLSALGGGTSTVKGGVRIQKVGDVSRWLLFDILSVVAAGGYMNLGVAVRASSSANPFVAGDQLMVFFDRKGDKGEGGNTPTADEMRAAIGTLPVANGGTGATTAEGARQALGAKAAGTEPIVTGGTGATTAAQALNNLGAMPKAGGAFDGPVAARDISALAVNTTNEGGRLYMNRASDNTSAHYWQAYGPGTNPAVRLVTPGGQVMTIANSGTVAAQVFTSTSDETLKENWRDLPHDFLEQFAAIERAGLFNWKVDGRQDAGVGAQSVQAIAPWAVHEVDGILRVNHAALNTAVLHALTRRVLAGEDAR